MRWLLHFWAHLLAVLAVLEFHFFFKCREWCMKHLMVEYRAADIKLLFPRQPKFCEHAGGGRPNDSKVDNLFHQTAFCAHIETTNGLPCIEFMLENQGS